MASRRISPKYSRTGRGDLWLAVGLDTRGLDSPWVCFRPPSRRRYVNVIMGVINPARTRLNLARSWGGPHADHASQPSIIRPRVHTSALVCTLTSLDIPETSSVIPYSYPLGTPWESACGQINIGITVINSYWFEKKQNIQKFNMQLTENICCVYRRNYFNFFFSLDRREIYTNAYF